MVNFVLSGIPVRQLAENPVYPAYLIMSGQAESDRRHTHPKGTYYHYTMAR